jgi:hypothetical protein
MTLHNNYLGIGMFSQVTFLDLLDAIERGDSATVVRAVGSDRWAFRVALVRCLHLNIIYVISFIVAYLDMRFRAVHPF